MNDNEEINKQIEILAGKRDEFTGAEVEPEEKLRLLRNSDNGAFGILNSAAVILFPVIQGIASRHAMKFNFFGIDKEEFIDNCLSGQLTKGENTEQKKAGLLYWFCAYDPAKGKITGYLHTVISNSTNDYIRRVAREASCMDRYQEEQNLAFGHIPPASNDKRSALLDAVETTIAKSSQVKRNSEIFKLNYSGHTSREIAGRMDLPIGTVKAIIRRLNNELRRNPAVAELYR